MARKWTLGLLVAAALVGSGSVQAATHHHRAALGQSRHAVRRHVGYGGGRPYGNPVSPTVTCRYPDGTPYDPDIIGGLNHVGAGGPAANFGGFDPCGF